MAFPTTPVLDNFNRANENPLSGGGNWLGPLFGSGPQLLLASNQVDTAVSEQRGSSYWSASFAADQEVYCDVPAIEQVVGLSFRQVNTGGATRSGYHVEVVSLSGPGNILVSRTDNDSDTALGVSMSANLNASDGIGVSIVGSTISVYTKISGTWSLLGTRTDSTYTSGGVVGIDTSTFGPSGQIDNFGGGDFVPVVGGSGLVHSKLSLPLSIGL